MAVIWEIGNLDTKGAFLSVRHKTPLQRVSTSSPLLLLRTQHRAPAYVTLLVLIGLLALAITATSVLSLGLQTRAALNRVSREHEIEIALHHNRRMVGEVMAAASNRLPGQWGYILGPNTVSNYLLSSETPEIEVGRLTNRAEATILPNQRKRQFLLTYTQVFTPRGTIQSLTGFRRTNAGAYEVVRVQNWR